MAHLEEVLSGQGQLPFGEARGPLKPGQPPPVKFPIGSLEGLEYALRELAWMKATEERLAAQHDKDVSARKDAMLQKLVIVVGPEGQTQTFDDRRAAIKAEAQKYCTFYRRRLLEKGAKSRKLNHGWFGWHESKPVVVELERPGKGPGNWLDTLCKLLMKAWAALPGLYGRAARFMKPKPTILKGELLKAFQEKQITPAELRQLGYRYRKPVDVFILEAFTQELESTSEGPK